MIQAMESEGIPSGNAPPLVSVLMPVYNTAIYLPRAIKSILSQSYTNIEFIIIDDGSTDSSLKILKKYAARDSRIRLVSRPNTGYVIALNEGLGMASGAYIARMDSDDLSLSNRIAEQVMHLNANPECVVVGGQAEMIDPDGWPLGPVRLPTDHESIDRQLIRGYPGAIYHPAAMIRTQVIRSLGGYRNQYITAEDYDLWLRMAEVGKLANLSDVVLYYRLHQSSVSASRKQLQYLTVAAVHADACIRRGIQCETPILPAPNPDPRVDWVHTAATAGHWLTAVKHSLLILFHEQSREAVHRLYWVSRSYAGVLRRRTMAAFRPKRN